jgi:hypothetical protein
VRFLGLDGVDGSDGGRLGGGFCVVGRGLGVREVPFPAYERRAPDLASSSAAWRPQIAAANSTMEGGGCTRPAAHGIEGEEALWRDGWGLGFLAAAEVEEGGEEGGAVRSEIGLGLGLGLGI